MDDAVQSLATLGDVWACGGGERQQRFAAATREVGDDSDALFDHNAPAAHPGPRGGGGGLLLLLLWRWRPRLETGPRAPLLLQLRSAFARARR